MSLLPVTASAPASSANLGPLFDVAGIALELRNEAVVRAGTGKVTIEGHGAGTLPADHTNLVAHAFAKVAPELVADVDIHCINRVPTARGLGSSTAAAACGLAAGMAALGRDVDPGWLATELTVMDGHPDNAAACAYGGLVLVPPGAEGLTHPVRLPLPDGLELVVVIPQREVPTAQARAALDATVPLADAVHQLQAATALATALATGTLDEAWFADALHGDRLHEAQRGGLVPELAMVRRTLSGSAGHPAYGATMSGAGPTILAWCHPGGGAHVRDLLAAALPDADVTYVTPALAGVRITSSH